MPGSATLGTDLVDSLVEVVDSLRDSLHPAMGVRQWRVFLVRRTWDGGAVGEGNKADVEVEITPQPLVTWDLVNRLSPAGLDENGNATLTEVSLTYTEAELTGQPLDDGVQFFYLLRDAHGQGMSDRYFSVKDPPVPDRIKNIGWVVKLIRQQVEDC